MQLADIPVGVLLVLACSGLGVYGVVLGGWATGSTYPLLGGLRSSAQIISYEVAMGLSFVAVFMTAGTMSTSQIVERRPPAPCRHRRLGPAGGWYAILLLPSFLIYFTSAVGETNRAPFDLPEAESELVGGFHTEYSSLKFALFFLAEYVNMVTVSALCATLFLGGWRAPWPISLWDGANNGWWPVLWFTIKVVVALFVFVWLRGTLPRLRYDQFMRFGWKVLIPADLIWILSLAGMRTMAREPTCPPASSASPSGCRSPSWCWPRCLSPAVRPTATPGSPRSRLPPARTPRPGPSPRSAAERSRRRPTGAPSRAEGGSPCRRWTEGPAVARGCAASRWPGRLRRRRHGTARADRPKEIGDV